jgi:hypothetical protein
VLELWLEETVVATPAVDEDERRIPASGLLVVEAEIVPPCVRHRFSFRRRERILSLASPQEG